MNQEYKPIEDVMIWQDTDLFDHIKLYKPLKKMQIRMTEPKGDYKSKVVNTMVKYPTSSR